MTVLKEGELQFSFDDRWRAAQFDRPGVSWPQGVRPVDFVLEGQDELILMEVKDPSASKAPAGNQKKFVEKMQSKELTHEELVPKARSSYGYLHLMERDTKPMRYVVVIGAEKLSIQPALLMNLTDRLRKRLAHEADTAWKRRYIDNCAVVAATDLGKALPGCSAKRT